MRCAEVAEWQTRYVQVVVPLGRVGSTPTFGTNLRTSCGYGITAVHQPSKLVIRVRPPLPAPFVFSGGVPEWLKGADCKSASSAFGGSNPPPTTIFIVEDLRVKSQVLFFIHSSRRQASISGLVPAPVSGNQHRQGTSMMEISQKKQNKPMTELEKIQRCTIVTSWQQPTFSAVLKWGCSSVG